MNEQNIEKRQGLYHSSNPTFQKRLTMKKYNILFMFLALLVTFSACDEFADDIDNVNPDVAENVNNNPELLLTGVIREPVNQMVGAGWSEGNLMAQYGARIVFTAFDQFEWGTQEGTWNRLYLSIRDAQQMKEIGRNLGNPSYEAVGLIMESWMFQILTDMWGDIPYSQAIQGKTQANYAPVYDPQEQIYTGLLDSLAMANTLLAGEDVPAVKGDILFNSDMSLWRKFANSLRMRVALRLSNVKPEVGQAVIQEISGNAAQYPVMESNADNAALLYLNSLPNVRPVTEASGYRSGSFNEYRMSETVEGVLRTFNDPRLQLWFNPTTNSVEAGAPLWSGMKNGIVDGVAYTYKGGDAFLSKFADLFYFQPNTVEGFLMKYDEVQFILAEAAQRGWISGEAQTFYENGIQAAFEYWNIPMPAGYLTQAGVAYDGTLATILTQKWLALFYTDYQGFIEFKRTGFPAVIQPGPDTFYDTYPSRFEYPTEERSINTTHYEEAMQRQQVDPSRMILAPVWWEGK